MNALKTSSEKKPATRRPRQLDPDPTCRSHRVRSTTPNSIRKSKVSRRPLQTRIGSDPTCRYLKLKFNAVKPTKKNFYRSRQAGNSAKIANEKTISPSVNTDSIRKRHCVKITIPPKTHCVKITTPTSNDDREINQTTASFESLTKTEKKVHSNSQNRLKNAKKGASSSKS
jgi:hypothetical protein